MKIFIGSLVFVSGMLCATSTWAQTRVTTTTPAWVVDPSHPAAVTAERGGVTTDRGAGDPEAAQLRQQMNEIEQGLYAVRQRLGLMGRDRNGIKDKEIAQLQEAAEKARKATEDKMREVLKADAEGGPILAQIDDLKKKASDLQQQQRDLEKQLAGIAQRMGMLPGRGDRGAAPAAVSVDPAIVTLRTEVEAANKALEDKITERIKADPEGAKLLQERDELNAKAQAKREHAQEHQERQPERQP